MKKTTTIQLPTSFDITTGQMTKTARRGNPVMTLLASQYASIGDDAVAQWNLANRVVQTPNDPDNPARGGNGWTLFYSCNSALLATGQPLASLPGTVSVPGNLPVLRAAITFTSPHNAPHILLSPQAQQAYPAGPSIAVWASPAVPLGNVKVAAHDYRASRYVFLGTYSGGLPLTGLDVTRDYLNCFPSIPASCRIAFKAMALTDNGFHSEVAYTFGDTPMLSLSAAAQGDTDLHLPASGE